MAVKVSVIVPTYCSSDASLRRLVKSLDAQTLPQQEFESVFVDDGSPDDTADRLRALAMARPNMRVLEVSHSGWPSKPRNAGIEAARGDYVLFMDHDDELFASALERGYEFGVANGSDIVNGRHVRSTGIGWAWDAYTADVTGLDGRKHLEMMQPMLVHRLYRREFLLAYDIRFPEGRRMLWEDNYFNVSTYVHARVVSVLSSVPTYLWNRDTGSNTLDTFERDVEEHWHRLGEVFTFFAATLTDARDLSWIRLRYYRMRVLNPWLGPAMLSRSAETNARALEFITAFVARHIPEALDQQLPKQSQARSVLLRTGGTSLLPELARQEQGITAVGEVEQVSWADTGLSIRAGATWVHSDAKPVLFRMGGGQLVRVLPETLIRALPVRVLDVADEIDTATSAVTFHRRGNGQPEIGTSTTSQVEARPQSESVAAVRHTAHAALDIDADTFGNALSDGTYDFGLRVSFMGHLAHRRLRCAQPTRVALLHGRIAIAYADRAGMLALQLTSSLARLLATTSPDVARASVSRRGPRSSLVRIPFTGVSVIGSTRMACELVLRPVRGHGPVVSSAAVVRTEADRVWLEAPVQVPPGRYRLEVVDDRSATWATDLWLRIGRSRRGSFERGDSATSKNAVPERCWS